ncbi:MAG: cohesin domain-containing protein [Candidatus Spyradenecus sp.]
MKRAHRKAPWLLLGLLGWALGASAAEVKVQQVDSLGNTLAEAAYVPTDEVFTSVSAPTQAGYRFAYWTISPDLATFANRDRWGRALDAVAFIPKDSVTTLTAVYLPTSLDEDKDGVADGEELYWYGLLGYGPESDTDGDGYTFAQELQFGLNPLFPDGLTLGGIAWGDSAQLLYNPNKYVPYTLRSEPEGELFATQVCYVSLGTEVTTKAYRPGSSTFAYWTVNGARQQDGFGRALDAATFTMGTAAMEIVAHCVSDESERQMVYWLGRVASPEEDTDGDGYTFAQELQFGLNPLFKDGLTLGGIAWGDSAPQETNLQPFDMASKALIEGELTDLFAVADALNGGFTGGQNFGGAVSPAVFDAEGDGLFDCLVYANGTLTLYRNRGQIGAPDFSPCNGAEVYPALAEALAAMARPLLCGGTGEDGPELRFCDNGGPIFAYDCTTDAITETGLTGWPVWSAQDGWGTFDGTTLHLSAGTAACDSAPTSVSAAALLEATGDNTADLLVADAEGRISLYQRSAAGLALKHRVWGGTYIGFAQGLTLAPVDWEGDGDGDMLAGTADGHLLLLTDPGVGRPTNLTATAGYDNVLLAWDPNAQSRVCGYTVYRAEAAEEAFARLAEALLPRYRDFPPSTDTWRYRVTTLSRLWKAGNSTPETFESAPSEALSVTLGAVTLSLPGGEGFLGQEVEAVLSIDNAAGLGASGLSLTVAYDPAALAPVGYTCSALSQALALTETRTEGAWHLAATGGTLTPGSGELFRLRFQVVAEAPGETALTLTEATLCSEQGQRVTVHLPDAPATFTLSKQPDPVTVVLAAQDAVAEDGRLTFTVTATPDGDLRWESFTVTPLYDSALLTLEEELPPTEATSGTYTFALTPAGEAARSVEVTFMGSAYDTNDEAARVESVTCRVLIPSLDDDEEGDEAGQNRPGWRPIVSLNAYPQAATPGENGYTVTEGGEVTLAVRVWRLGRLDWSSLELTPHFDPTELELLDEGNEPLGNALSARERTFTFRVLAPAGWHRNLALRFSGTARGTNGTMAIVWPALVVLHVAERPHPDVVKPWTNGDCDGDGRLTGRDYQVAFETVKRYHPHGGGKKPPQHTEEAWLIHRSLCQAIGKPPEANLELADVTNTYKKYLWERGVTDTNMGNPGGKQ